MFINHLKPIINQKKIFSLPAYCTACRLFSKLLLKNIYIYVLLKNEKKVVEYNFKIFEIIIIIILTILLQIKIYV